MASRNDRRASEQGAPAGQEVPAEADSEPHRDDGCVPPGRRARQRQAAAGFDWRLPAVDPGIKVGRKDLIARAFALLAVAALAACGKQAAEENGSATVITNSTVPAGVNQPGVTPMAQRVAVLGILNKRNGIVQNVSLHPGQSVRWKDVVVRLRAC